MRDTYNSSTQVINLAFDFTHRRYTFYYFTFSDVISKMGGLRSVILPVFDFVIPLLVLYFLVELITIVQN